MELREWWRLQEETKRRDPDAEPGVLAPPEAFGEERGTPSFRRRIGLARTAEEVGARSRTVRRRIASSCAGWPVPPTAEEFHQAVRAAEPTERQGDLVSMWVLEATWTETLLAWAEEAYSWRELVRAIHASGAADDHLERNRELNGLAEACDRA